MSLERKKRREREKNNSRVQKGVFGYSAQKRTKGPLFVCVCLSVPMMPKFVSDKGHYFILEYISYNNRLFVFLQPYFHTGVKQRGFIVLAAPRALQSALLLVCCCCFNLPNTELGVFCVFKKISHRFCLRLNQ